MEDPFPDAPSYDELGEKKVNMSEFDDLKSFTDANREWYNDAIPVAARLMVQVAREYEEFREQLLSNDDEVGTAHRMSEYDSGTYQKLNQMGLSALQGGQAENLAREELREDSDE